MNKDQKAALVQEIASDLGEAQTIFAVDYRGISVSQAAELRSRLADADATFKVVKNRLAKRAAEQAGVEQIEELLSGPTALTYVKGDPVLAAKAISTFARAGHVLSYKGGVMDGSPLEPDRFEAIARLPALEVLHGQLVGVTASPLTGLVRGLASLLSGLAVALGQIQEKGLVGGEAEAEATPAAEEEAPAEEEGAPAAEEAEPAEAEARAEAEEAGQEEEESAEAAEPGAEPEPEAEEGDSDRG
jgi:large subunit ribosomal protein L10